MKTYPVSAGVKGGLAGSVAMAVLACAYGVLKAGSIWYPDQSSCRSRVRRIAEARARTAVFIPCRQLRHCSGSPRARVCAGWIALRRDASHVRAPTDRARRTDRPGAVVGAAVHDSRALLNPLLASHIDWPWFIASQVAFGIVAGLVVVRQSRMPTRENLSFAIRAGIEAPGIIPPRENGEERP